MNNAQQKLPPVRQPQPAFRGRAAFTLIELLVVIAIIGVIAGMVLTVMGGVKKTEYINTATAELKQIESALETYKTQYGAYPPSNQSTPNNPYLSPLYFELAGVRLTNSTYVPLDGATNITAANYKSAFGIDSPVNCAKSGDDGEASKARSFLTGLSQNRIGDYSPMITGVRLLITSSRGPDQNYQPVGVENINPFRYEYPGTNNPNSYDLWVQLSIGGKKYLICNWNGSVQVNNPLP